MAEVCHRMACLAIYIFSDDDFDHYDLDRCRFLG